MKTRFGLLSLAVLLAGTSNLHGTEGEQDYRVLVLGDQEFRGTHLPTWEKLIISNNAGFSVRYIIVDTSISRLRLVLPVNPEGGGSALWDFFREEKASAAFTGGYLGSFFPPTPQGLVRIERKTINNSMRDPVLSGVICLGHTNDEAAILITTFPSNSIAEWSSCIQSGPLLVLKGTAKDDLSSLDALLAPRETEASKQRQSPFTAGAFERAFVLRNPEGRIILGVTTPMPLYTLKSLITLPSTEGGFNAVDAIVLTGWHTAGLISAAEKPVTGGTPSTLLPNAIIVTPLKAPK
jgi:hypothetical protein